jgi:hypothetical protein
MLHATHASHDREDIQESIITKLRNFEHCVTLTSTDYLLVIRLRCRIIIIFKSGKETIFIKTILFLGHAVA